MGELWCFTNLEQWNIRTFSNKETHDLFQGRFTTTAHGDIIHSPKTGHTLWMKWWFVDGRNANHHKFNHFLKCFVCTEHSPKTNTTKKSNNLKMYLQTWWLSIAMLVYWKVHHLFLSWPLLLYIRKRCVWPPPRWGQPQHISAPCRVQGPRSAWYIMIHDLNFLLLTANATENRSQCFFGTCRRCQPPYPQSRQELLSIA